MFPTRNGWIDRGEQLGEQVCPNCGSTTGYRQTVSLEECTACGFRCNYWGEDGANDVYQAMMARRDTAQVPLPEEY